MRQLLKAAFQSRGVYYFPILPRGIDVFYDLRHSLPRLNIEIIFDVGANIGQSIDGFITHFPSARFWSFEPAAVHYEQLCRRYRWNDHIKCEHLAIGAFEDETILNQTNTSTMYHIATGSQNLPKSVVVNGTEKVTMTTLDGYCQRNAIERIDFLKIDTEGYELEVLRGGNKLLSRRLISCVQCECGVNPDNRFHRPLDNIQQFLETKGYRLFGFYEQAAEFHARTPNLRRVNAVFISPDVIELNCVDEC